MKRFLLTIMVVALVTSVAQAQKQSGFAIYPYVNYQASDIPASASRTLEKKLLSLVTANGIAATESDFVITAIADVVEKNVTNTAPAMTVAKVEIEIFLLDNAEKLIVSQKLFTQTGVGRSSDQAVNKAVGSLNVKSVEARRFMENARKKLEEHYAEKEHAAGDSLAVAVEPAWFFEKK